jgi:hypothetical protein
LSKHCEFCGRFFVPDHRVGNRQRACSRPECKAERKQASQKKWVSGEPGYFLGRYRPNEKGRVERVIRDIRSFLYTQHPKDLADLNRLVDQWQRIRNNTPHSMTGRSPSDASFDEPLKKLPAVGYSAHWYVNCPESVAATFSKLATF